MIIRPETGQGKPFKRFWRATGFSPGELLLTPEMKRTMSLLSGTPLKGVHYLRPHYMLNMIRAVGLDKYDFSLFDEAMDVMVENGFLPCFEIMGNPSDSFDFSAEGWESRWRDLVLQITSRSVERYGFENVSDWMFESWNEPDSAWWTAGEPAFMRYYDASVAGVEAVSKELTIGGAGTCKTMSPMFKAFVKHLDTGTNFLTGEEPRADFISIHEKGVTQNVEDLQPNTVAICEREMLAINHIRENHPRLAHIPIVNNECDPQVGWWHHHSWRATAYCPAIITKIIDQHQRLHVDEGVPFDLLFNDNGFMGSWGQRTQYTLIGGRGVVKAQSEHVTDIEKLMARDGDSENFSLVKKPALTVMEMLAQLGSTRFPMPHLTPDAEGPGAIVTRHEDGTWATVLYNSRDAIRVSGTNTVTLDLPDTTGEWDVLVQQLNDTDGTPFSVWEKAGVRSDPNSPLAKELRALGELEKLGHPTPDELTAMRAMAEPHEKLRETMSGGVKLHLDLPVPSVTLVVARPSTSDAPPAPAPKAMRTGGVASGEVIVSWPDLDSVGLCYDVGVMNGGEIKPLNPHPILATVYTLGGDHGAVHVRSVSLGGNRGEWVEARVDE
jgi:L-iduronidase